ncbi:MAG: outer membrane protein transport protein [Muribaculaceae bacterium]|nr:outer membrane protein transport protein [Muribaculaceae bacterium]
MKKIYLYAAAMAVPFIADAQSAIDGFRFSQPDMKGTARYMGMGGAFGALGGDLSSISTNPAGIGVYRRNEIGITMDVDIQSATSEAQGFKNSQSQTKVLLNNVGGVASWNLMNSVMPNLNIGFTYNRAASFNAHYVGSIPTLSNSLTNYIAGTSNKEGVTVADVTPLFNDKGYLTFDPYNPNDGGYAAPWLSILGYNSYFITPTGDDDQPNWIGQWGVNTSGSGAFDVMTTGGANEYNIAIGGNIANKVFWGIDFGIVDMDYSMTAIWGENLQNAVVDNPYGGANSSSLWKMTNSYNASGTGYNIKVGFIYRPIQELRLGVSFASPTWYSINESYMASTNYQYSVDIPDMVQNRAVTNNGEWGLNSYNFRTPWRLTASAAGVIGRSLILSADFEWQKYDKMRFYDGGNGYYDYDYGDWDWDSPFLAPARKAASPALINTDPWYATNADIEDYYKSTTSIRVGAEYRITPRFSVRAGYAHVSSPVSTKAKDGSMLIYTSGTLPNYRMDNSTDYITCGLGYNFNNFYVDAAYVNKHQSSEYHAYTPDPVNPQIPSPTSKLSLNNNQIVLSAGVRF